MYCTKCGKEIEEGLQACPYCWNTVEITVDHSPAPTTPTTNYAPPSTYQNPTPPSSPPAQTVNPTAGFVLSIIGVAMDLTAWYGVSTLGYYNNKFALWFAIIGLALGAIALILILVHRSNFKSLHGIGVVGLVLSIVAVALALILIMEYSSNQNLGGALSLFGNLF